MVKIIGHFERIVVLCLLVMMMAAVGWSLLELAWLLFLYLSDFHTPLLAAGELLNVFGYFLLILIGLELAETIKAYLDENVLHVEVVFLVALIAVARKVTILDLTKDNPLSVFALAALILALSAGYYFIKRALTKKAVLPPKDN